MSPRQGWRETVALQGLVFSDTTDPITGVTTSYWNEHACYELTMSEVDLSLIHI